MAGNFCLLSSFSLRQKTCSSARNLSLPPPSSLCSHRVQENVTGCVSAEMLHICRSSFEVLMTTWRANYAQRHPPHLQPPPLSPFYSAAPITPDSSGYIWLFLLLHRGHSRVRGGQCAHCVGKTSRKFFFLSHLRVYQFHALTSPFYLPVSTKVCWPSGPAGRLNCVIPLCHVSASGSLINMLYHSSPDFSFSFFLL